MARALPCQGERHSSGRLPVARSAPAGKHIALSPSWPSKRQRPPDPDSRDGRVPQLSGGYPARGRETLADRPGRNCRPARSRRSRCLLCRRTDSPGEVSQIGCDCCFRWSSSRLGLVAPDDRSTQVAASTPPRVGERQSARFAGDPLRAGEQAGGAVLRCTIAGSLVAGLDTAAFGASACSQAECG